MSIFKAVRVKNVRTHKDFTLQLSPQVTVITGKNGSGKTSLIEALYVALRGSSFKGSDTDVLKHDAPWYRIDIESDHEKRTVKFEPDRPTGRKQFIIDTKAHYRLPQQYKYPVVLFEPEDLRLLNGSPVRRRQFIDRFIAQLDPKYSIALRRYERALRQRNSLLKQQANQDALFAWNISLSEYGSYIVEQRIHFIHELNEQLERVYKKISHTNDSVAITYSYPRHDSTKQRLLAELHAHIEKERILGYTLSGPHRHDVMFEFNHSPALSVASRGEVRSIVLALKMLETEIIERITDKAPLVLLDDVFSELDSDRQNYLIDAAGSNQIIITSATNNSAIHTDYITNLSE